MAKWDIIIAGHGIAGAVLAATLREAGQRVLVVDPEESVTSSRIAAGVVTPITGRRLALSWRVEMFWPLAHAFYQKHWPQHWHPLDQVRRLVTPQEVEQWEKRLHSGADLSAWMVGDAAPLDAAVFHGPVPSLTMRSAWLDVAGWLECSRHSLLEAGAWRKGTVEPGAVECPENGVTLRLGDSVEEARYLVFCQGHAAAGNPLFPWISWRSAKGEILEVECPPLMENRVVHQDGWLLPVRPGYARAGATYVWDRLDQVPTAEARATLEARLRATLRVPFTITGHRAAVRPVIRESKAVIGLHPALPRIGFFNGLGSKGVLNAPWFAQALAGLILHGIPLENEVDLRRN